MWRIGVLTSSDKGAKGEREDTSGDLIRQEVAKLGEHTVTSVIVPDDTGQISRQLILWSDEERLDLVLTTGGTGLGPRDVTPEATLAVIDRQVPGLSEAMRSETSKITPLAILARQVAGVRGRTLIINLPGSPKAVRECLAVILPVLPHALGILTTQIREHPKT